MTIRAVIERKIVAYGEALTQLGKHEHCARTAVRYAQNEMREVLSKLPKSLV